MMASQKTIFIGFFMTAESIDKLNIVNGFISVEDGMITNMGTKSQLESAYTISERKQYNLVELPKGYFVIPGFVDSHTHAPQFPNIGLGLDRPLLEWLAKYTFPLEKKYSDTAFAASVYGQVVKRLIKNGTTTACYFGSLSTEGTLQLVSSVVKYKQRALVGKVSMNIKNEAGYYNTTETEVVETEKFVSKVLEFESDLIQPIITPRFAPSCDTALMTSLSQIAAKYNCMIQSHISENKDEIQHVLNNNPRAKHYTDIYDNCKLLNDKCIMAHAVHLSEKEMEILSERGVSIAHCPASNTRLMSGLCPIKQILSHNITVGLGTDVSGGDSPSIMDAMRRAMDVSLHLFLKGEANEPLSSKEAFYLATLGGAKALNLDHKVGSLEIGKEFDALIINVYKDGGAIDNYDYSIDSCEAEVGESLLQRFIYLGDDRNIEKVFVKGVEVKAECL